MEYIVYNDFNEKIITGEDLQIPKGEKCYTYENIICFGDKPICLTTSENAHRYFARNNDGNGVYRGELINEILTILDAANYEKGEFDETRQKLWYRIMSSPFFAELRRTEIEDRWVWSHDFYNASITLLEKLRDTIRR